MKPRVLLVTEFSKLPTGYGLIGRELLTRLNSTGKYELAEFSAYVHYNDQRTRDIPWKLYCNHPTPGNKEDERLHDSSPVNQFGAYRFEEVLLDFRPTHVLSFRDPWMDSFICSSPYRKCYRQIWMPTCDSEPLEEAWIEDYINCDGIISYSDWGGELLNRQSGGKIKYFGSAGSGVNLNEFFPYPNKQEHRKQFGIDTNVNIIGTVMRNQKRKLFNEIMESFNGLLSKYPKFKENTFLYFHTTYPDSGWDMPRLLKDYGLGNKVLFTYVCGHCNYFFPSFFIDSRTICPRCNTLNAFLPNQKIHLDSSALCAVYNLFDLYLQYPICEGFGVPIVEASACGLPNIVLNYSSMCDFPDKLGSIPIEIGKAFLECETHAYRAYPDNQQLIEELNKFLSLPKPIRSQKGFQARKGVEEHYNWDKIMKIWEDAIDSISAVSPEEGWNSRPDVHSFQGEIPNIQYNEEFVRWAMINILREPKYIDSYMYLRMTRDLNYGAYLPGYGGLYLSENSILGSRPVWQPFDRNCALNKLQEIRSVFNYWEQRRVGLIQEPPKDFIIAANNRK